MALTDMRTAGVQPAKPAAGLPAGRRRSEAGATGTGAAAVRVWLWCCAGLVFAMVVVGGATRLTESGLSITEWKLVSGILPPFTDAQWQAEFEKYKQIPQYSRLFPTMDLGWFQFIYLFEWGHRLLGRLIGVIFAVPMLVFWISGRLPGGLKPQLVVLLALGALQGAVGWWMVKSGLSERVEVSQYRLALHLILASATFSWLVWLAVGLSARPAPATVGRLRLASVLVALVLLQIGLGALVAGLRAGLTYNTWPLMDGQFIPPAADLLRRSPWWINLFENVTTVQFLHRMTAYLVLAVALVNAGIALRAGGRAAVRALVLAGLVVVQAAIGITTLVLAVPIWAGLLHQAFAMLVLGKAVMQRRLLVRDGAPSSLYLHGHRSAAGGDRGA